MGLEPRTAVTLAKCAARGLDRALCGRRCRGSIAAVIDPAEHPALAQRWCDEDALAEASASWRAVGAVRLEDALAPGLAAELAVGLTRLPLQLVEAAGEVAWLADVAVPPVRDPQLFEPLFRAVHLVRVTLPALVRALAGRVVVAAHPELVRVVGYRKGSWTEAAQGEPAGAIAATIAITGAPWPRAWGGHDARLDGSGGERWCVEPRPGAIELADAASVRRVEVVTHRVERVELRALLVPEAA